MKLITTLFLTTLTVVGAAAASSTTTSVRAVKGAESPSRKLYSSDSYGGGDNYGSSGYSSGYSSGGSSSHHSAPKPKTKQTKKPKAAPKPKAKAHPSSSHHSSGGSSSSSGYSSYNSWSNDGHDSSGYTEVGYGAVGVLGLAAAILAKKKCSPQDGPTIDATDILEGDYVNDDCSIQSDDVPPPPPDMEGGSFVEMTDSEQEKPIRSAAYQLVHTHSSEPGSEYVPNSFGTASPPAEADSVIHEEEEATSGAALV